MKADDKREEVVPWLGLKKSYRFDLRKHVRDMDNDEIVSSIRLEGTLTEEHYKHIMDYLKEQEVI